MVATILHSGKTYRVDFFQPIDISMPLHTGTNCASAWYVAPIQIEPVRMGDWVGDVKQGGSVNFRTITFNPHGNGTHTECVGHISKEDYSINQCLKRFMFAAELISVLPEENADGDRIISKRCVELCLENRKGEALIIRTISNSPAKLVMNYSNSNPPYLTKEAIEYILSLGYEHLLIDMPSVDKEVDNGVLAAHHAFWEYPHNTQTQRTITEMIYVPNDVIDGTYILNMQIASFENDASPSKPVLYKVM
ncbi:MAG: cyclase family protein [Bacteroidetes bacterium]|nr:cyclase family protein [Bacteroidota bacterium]